MKKVFTLLLFGMYFSLTSFANGAEKTNCPLKSSQCHDQILKDEKILLAQALHDTGDPLSALIILNGIIAQRESQELYDQDYLSASYEAAGIYLLFDTDKALEIGQKARSHDKRLPVTRIEDGYLIMEKCPAEALEDDDARELMIRLLVSSGMCESPKDIIISGTTVRVKMKSCCSCDFNSMKEEIISFEKEKRPACNAK